MKKNIPFIALVLCGLTAFLISCEKDPVATVSRPQPQVQPVSFLEEFDSVGNLTAKGWVFKNNSFPVGQNGWRQGVYESGVMVQYKFLGPVPYIGFPAYSAKNSPREFVSVDVSAVNEALDPTGSGQISAWLIGPQRPMKNGDQIIFLTRAADDSNYPVYTKDRMQVRANFTDGSADVGTLPSDTGNFKTVLLDINPNYINNDPGGNPGGAVGYPRTWTRYRITLSGIPAGGVTNGRFAFRYLASDAGLAGGPGGTNFPTIIGVDSLAFIRN